MCRRSVPLRESVRPPVEEGAPDARPENEAEYFVDFEDELEPLIDDEEDWEDDDDFLDEQTSTTRNDNRQDPRRYTTNAERDRSPAAAGVPQGDRPNRMEQVQTTPCPSQTVTQTMEQIIWNNLASLTCQTLMIPLLQQYLSQSARLHVHLPQPYPLGMIPDVNLLGFIALVFGPQFAMMCAQQRQQNQTLILIMVQLGAILQQLEQRNAASQGNTSKTTTPHNQHAHGRPHVRPADSNINFPFPPTAAAASPIGGRHWFSTAASASFVPPFASSSSAQFSWLLSLFCAVATLQQHAPSTPATTLTASSSQVNHTSTNAEPRMPHTLESEEERAAKRRKL